MTIADLRKDMGLSLEAFAQLIGLQSRGRMSVIERENRCSLTVALKIEEVSGGRINAASLSEEVRAARHVFEDGLRDVVASPDVAVANIGGGL